MSNENTKKSAFQKFWDSLPKKERGEHRRKLLAYLHITETVFYSKLNKNSFEAHERAIIAEYFGKDQKEIFPEVPVVFQNPNLKNLQ